MLSSDAQVLGWLVLLLGVGIALFVLLALHFLPRLRTASVPLSETLTSPASAASHNEALLVVQRGGRLTYLNRAARELFNYWESTPNLESLARRLRPSEAFLALCLAEGQGRFSLNGIQLEGVSYSLPPGIAIGRDSVGATMVVLRRAPLSLTQEGAEGAETALSLQALPFIAELSQAMAASLDLEVTLKTILENFERLFPSDDMQVAVWDSEIGQATLYRLVGVAGVERRLERSSTRLVPGEGYLGYVLATRQPLLIEDTRAFREVLPAEEGKRYPYRSYLGVPLLVGGELVGALEMASLQRNHYTQSDVQVVNLLVGQAAIAINNALLHRKELQRSVEMSGLANLAQAVGALRDPEDLYRRLIASLAPLLEVEILGFLVYDENRRVLEGQQPFQGLQPNALEWCRAVIAPGSPAEALLLKGDTLVVSDAPNDERIQALGLHHLAQAAGIRQTVLVPLTSGGKVLGYLQAANKRDGAPFDSGDLHVLAIIAGQVAPILENAQLVIQGRRRTQRAETLRRIASLTSSGATLEEMLKYALLDLARLLQVDVAAVFLLDKERGVLYLPPEASYGLSPLAIVRLDEIGQEDPRFAQTACASLQQVLLHDLAAEAPAVPSYYRALATEWGMQSLLVTPILGREGSLGEWVVGSGRAYFFQESDAQTLATAASLIAAAIERHPLSEGDELQFLQRLERLRAGLEIAAVLHAQISFDQVWRLLGEKMREAMGFDLVLVAQGHADSLEVVYTSGELPEDLNLPILLGPRNPLRQVLQSGELLMVNDLEQASEWGNAPLLRAVEARAFLCIPLLLHKGRDEASERPPLPPAALLCVARRPLAPFTDDDRRLFDLLARQAAAALQNIRLVESAQRRLEEVNLLLDFSQRLGGLDPESILQALVESALRLIPNAQMALAALWDERQGLLRPLATQGYPHPQALSELAYRPGEGVAGQVFESGQPLNLETVDFRRYYNLTPQNLAAYRKATAGKLPVSSLAVPLIPRPLVGEVGATRPLGVLVLDSVQTTGAFRENDLAVVASLAQQTALSLEGARLYQSSRQRSTQLQALTQVSTAIISSLRSQDLTAALLDLLRAVLPYDTATLWLRSSVGGARERMVVRAARGFADDEDRQGLVVDLQDSALMSEMITSGHPLYVADVRLDPRFRPLAMAEGEDASLVSSFGELAPRYCSWLGVPLIASGRVLGVIALEKEEPHFYSPEDIQIATTFAAQAAVSLANAELYEESVRRAVELDQRTQTLSILNRLSAELSSSLDVERVLGYAVQEFHQLMECNAASACVVIEPPGPEEGERMLLLHSTYPPLAEEAHFLEGMALPWLPLLDRLAESGGIFNSEEASADSDLAPWGDFLRQTKSQGLLIVPLLSAPERRATVETAATLLGLLIAHESEARRFAAEKVELARTIGNQVAIALQNARLMAEMLRLTEDLEQRVRLRTAELSRERQRAEALLRIITELSASLDLEQVLHRTLRVLGEYVEAAQAAIFIARPDEKRIERLAVMGTGISRMRNVEAPLALEQNLAQAILTQRGSMLITNLLAEGNVPKTELEEFARRYGMQPRSVLGVPLMSGAETLGCLLLYHPHEGHFSLEHLDLVQAAANQVSVAVNNAELYRLIRDQAEDLGTMLRNQQVETSRTRAILEAVADGVLVTDANRVITLFNESAEKILGLGRSQVLGKSLEHFAGLFGTATHRWMEAIRAWSRDPSACQAGERFAERITLEDGRVIYVQLAPVTMRNEFLGTVSIFQDITHQVEVDRLKSEFVATVSHELRTPMTSIKGYVDILLMGAAGSLNEQQRHFLQVVQDNTERLTVLVNDLLDISRIESGRMTPNLQVLDLAELIRQVVEDFRRRLLEDEKHLTVQLSIPEGLPHVQADPEHMRRVLDNLLDNAYQYNLPNGTIEVRLSHRDGEIQVDVRDSGMGIPPEEQERIFERFYRGENTLLLGVAGTGLGLSIVRSLVSMHGGRIWVESAGIPGKGSTFSFTLPVAPFQVGGDTQAHG